MTERRGETVEVHDSLGLGGLECLEVDPAAAQGRLHDGEGSGGVGRNHQQGPAGAFREARDPARLRGGDVARERQGIRKGLEPGKRRR